METLELNTSASMPVIGLGTWQVAPEDVAESVRYAIVEAGYRHIDCASIYANEVEVGKGIALALESGIKREDLFITSKLWNTDHQPERVAKACNKTLQDLQLDYLDLYLVHWALPFVCGDDLRPVDENGVVRLEKVPLQTTWRAMEKLVDEGLTKAIGVANFDTALLVDLSTYARIAPAVNQIELHPHLPQTNLVQYCKANDIVVTAYSPLGSTGSSLLKDETLAEVAKKHSKSPAQIMLAWAVGRETIAIPRSTNPQRISENIDIFDIELDEDDLESIANINIGKRYVDPIDWWGLPYFG